MLCDVYTHHNISLPMLPFHKTNDRDIDYNTESKDKTSDGDNINTDCFKHYDQANLWDYISTALVSYTMKCNTYYNNNLYFVLSVHT